MRPTKYVKLKSLKQPQEVKTFSHYSLGSKQISEKELVDRAKIDPDYFGILYDVYMRQIYGFTLKRVGNVELAEDLTSQTFEKALRKLKSFSWQDVSFSAWLYRIAANNIIDHYRRKGRRPQTNIDNIPEPDDGQERVDVSVSNKLFIEKVQSVLPLLDDSDQQVLTLKLFADRSNDEISEVMKLEKAHVAVRVHRALKKLRKKLEEVGIDY